MITAEAIAVYLGSIRDLPERVGKAIEIAAENGWIDGNHHKMWVIDQMLRVLLGPGYERWREYYEAPDELGEAAEWDEGIAP